MTKDPARRIVLVLPDLKGNGAERVSISMARAFRDAGHESHIVVFSDRIELPVPSDIPVHRFHFRGMRMLPRSWRGPCCAPALDRFIRRTCGEPDLVFSSLAPVDRILACSRLPGVHIMIHNTVSAEMQGQFNDRTGRELTERLRLFRRKPCVAVSEGVAEDLRELLPDKLDITRIYSPVDLDLIRKQGSLESDIEIPEGCIVNVSTFAPRKRHDLLLRAYAQSGTDRHLVLIGQGGELETVRALARELNVEDRVHFTGFQSNPYALMRRASLFVLSSDFEGLGMVLLEAIALGVATISTDCPSGPAEILPATHLVPVDDVDALAALIRKAAADPEAWRIPFPEQFQTETLIQNYLELIPTDSRA